MHTVQYVQYMQYVHVHVHCTCDPGIDITHLSREEGKDLSDDGIESLADLGLFVHLHVEPVGHLVILHMELFKTKTGQKGMLENVRIFGRDKLGSDISEETFLCWISC